MIPGFVNIYKDDEGFVHLYFYNGIDDDNNEIYYNIDLTGIPFSYSCKKNDLVTDYKFDDKSIVKIKCNLVPRNTTLRTQQKILHIS